MNGFVPVLVAVLLAEFGQRGSRSSKSWHDAVVWVGMAGIALAASVAGQLVAARMTDWAAALMIAIALALAAVGQLLKAKPRDTVTGQLWGFWSGGVPLLAFAFATRFGPWAAGLGALAGSLIAAIATSIALRNAVPLRLARAVGATLLLGSAGIVAVNALRLV